MTDTILQHNYPKLPTGLSWVDGGICAPRGFQACGVHAGFRRNRTRNDLALIVSDEPCAAAATFTQNVFCAAPVLFSKQQFEAVSGCSSYGQARAIVINSRNANAATGVLGMQACKDEANLVGNALGCSPSDVLIASTGVIGVQLSLEPFEVGLPKALSALSCSDKAAHDAAEAIMTTDTFPKECALEIDGALLGNSGKTYHIGGLVKGSGMIMPNMATMIAVITTDAPLKSNDLYTALREAVGVSFNKVTVDSDTSTNDTCFALASGINGGEHDFVIDAGTQQFEQFVSALKEVCVYLARLIAVDGEGATRLIDVNVQGAKTPEDADMAARTIANSPLVKTAIAGRDANWGRIAAALGRSGASFNQEDVDISIMGIDVCKDGLALDFDEDEALKRFEQEEIIIDVDLHAGNFSTTVWTCDFTHEYISINADYRT